MTQPARPPRPSRTQGAGGIPLRPVSIPEAMSVAWTIVRRHPGALLLPALLLQLVSAGISLAVLAGTHSLATFASGQWAQDIVAGKTTSLPVGVVVAELVSILLGPGISTLLAGIAAGAVAQDLGSSASGSFFPARLHGRWLALIGMALLSTALVTVGTMALLVPGLILYLVLAIAGPVVVMERASPSTTLRRCWRLTTGHKGRILLASAVAGLSGALLAGALAQLVGGAAGSMSALAAVASGQALAALGATFASAWGAAMFAVIYTDIRIRREGLADALRAATLRRGPAYGV